MIDHYPVLRSDVRVRHYGECARVSSRAGRFRAFTVNRNGGQILNLCSGRDNLRAIIHYLLGESADRGEIGSVMDFVKQLGDLDVLECPAEPRPRDIDSAGSTKTISPQVVSLELTEQCNFHCRYCYQNSSSLRKGFISDPIAMLTYLRERNVAGIELTGGEPLLHPRFNEIIAFAMANFDLLGLITNGSLLRESHLERLAAGPCMAAVQVCLDGFTPAMVEATTGVTGSFEMEVNAIRRVKDYGIVLRVGMVVDSPEKIDAMEATLKLARDLGADSFIAHPCIDFGRGAAAARVFDIDDHKRLNDCTQDLRSRYKGFFARETELPGFDFNVMNNCGGGHRALTVDWRGKLKPCPMISSEELNLGHWRDLESGACQRKMKAYHELEGPKANVCGDCGYLAYCFNCIVRALKAGRMVENCRWRTRNKELLREIGA